MYDEGRGVHQDDAEALQWFHKAAEHGDPFAQYELGVRYLQGRGVARDDAEAVRWLKSSAKLGFSPAVEYLHAQGMM
jgi:TPR repeat protein